MVKKLNRKIKILLTGIGAFALIAAFLFVFRTVRLKKVRASQTYQVFEEQYENAIQVAGTVSAAQEQTLQALSSGTVVDVFVKQGDVVKKGDVIIQLDDTEQKYNLAKHDYEMKQTAAQKNWVVYNLQKTQRLSLVQKISDRKVTATFDGIIADIDVKVGNSLEAKDPVGTLVDVSYLVADVEIPENDVAKLKVGQEVSFTFPSCREKVTGYVVSWPNIGEVTSRGATVVKTRLRIDKYPESILPNFTFSGKIKVSDSETMTIVSQYAIGREDGKAFVKLAKTGEKREVKVKPYGKEFVRILSGNLNPGDELEAQSQPKVSGSKAGKTGSSSQGKKNGMQASQMMGMPMGVMGRF